LIPYLFNYQFGPSQGPTRAEAARAHREPGRLEHERRPGLRGREERALEEHAEADRSWAAAEFDEAERVRFNRELDRWAGESDFVARMGLIGAPLGAALARS
jgi:hypothetical protein